MFEDETEDVPRPLATTSPSEAEAKMSTSYRVTPQMTPTSENGEEGDQRPSGRRMSSLRRMLVRKASTSEVPRSCQAAERGRRQVFLRRRSLEAWHSAPARAAGGGGDAAAAASDPDGPTAAALTAGQRATLAKLEAADAVRGRRPARIATRRCTADAAPPRRRASLARLRAPLTGLWRRATVEQMQDKIQEDERAIRERLNLEKDRAAGEPRWASQRSALNRGARAAAVDAGASGAADPSEYSPRAVAPRRNSATSLARVKSSFNGSRRRATLEKMQHRIQRDERVFRKELDSKKKLAAAAKDAPGRDFITLCPRGKGQEGGDVLSHIHQANTALVHAGEQRDRTANDEATINDAAATQNELTPRKAELDEGLQQAAKETCRAMDYEACGAPRLKADDKLWSSTLHWKQEATEDLGRQTEAAQDQPDAAQQHRNNTSTMPDMPQRELNNVLYYKHYRWLATPTKGKLVLGKSKLSFQPDKPRMHRECDFAWNLNAISAENFEGRIHSGMRLCLRRQTTAWLKGEKIEASDVSFQKHIFTRVDPLSLEMIRTAIAEAKGQATD